MHQMRVKRFFSGISLDELGARVNIDQGKLSRIERGYVTSKAGEKETIAKVLNCHVDEIFPIEDEGNETGK